MKTTFDKPYFANLDALRFFAFLCVFCSHCVGFFGYTFSNKYAELVHKHYFQNGNLGVSFFFVLSGFLISWLLLLELKANGSIKVGAFYMRRILRIWPVYFAVVAAGFAIGTCGSIPLLDRHAFPYAIRLDQLGWYISFLANYDLILNGISSVLLSVLWSVSIEEQFYVAWPLLFLALNRKSLPYLCWGIILGAFIFRCFPFPNSGFSTLAVMSDLAAGALLAYYCLHRPRFVDFIKTLSKRTILFLYLLFFLYVPAKGFSHMFGEQIYRMYYPFESVILAGFFSFIVLEQVFAANSFFKFGKIALFGRLGKISYGLYAYHMLTFPPAFAVAGWLGLADSQPAGYALKILVSFLATVLISSLSYRFYEQKILSLKKHFQPQQPPAGGNINQQE